MLTYGLIANGTKVGTAQTVAFQGVSATRSVNVQIEFPEATAANQQFYVEYPQTVVVDGIFNKAFQHRDETSQWNLVVADRRWLSPRQSAGFGGLYSFTLAVPAGG